MAYTVFDGVAKFTADSSQLDQFIVKLEQGLSSASEKAAASTRELKSAQQEFRAAIQAVSAESGDTTANLERLAQAEKNLALAAAAAKQEHAALKEQLIGTKESASVAGQATEELTGHLAKMFGIMAAAEGFKSLIEGAQRSVLGLELLSEKTGIAIDTLAGIQHVAEASRVSFEQVETALTRLSRAQVLAIEGGKAQVTAFERIGISANELKSLSPEEMFYRVAGAMSNAKSHGEEAASAFALLGRGGAALIPIFNQGGDALRGMVAEAAKASGVTDAAGKSAREWEAQTANLSEAFRSGLIPVMQAAVPVIRVVEELGSDVAMVFRDLGAALGGLGLVFIDQAKGMGAIIGDVWDHNWTKLVSDAKAAADTTSNDMRGIGEQFKQNFQQTADSIKNIWTDVKPLKPADDDLSDLTAKNKKAMQEQVADAKVGFDQRLADIEQWKAGMHAAYASGQIDLATWKVAELEAADAVALAHEQYLARLITIYTKAGDVEKAHSKQLELVALQTKDAAKETDALAAAMEKHRQAAEKVVDAYAKLVNTGVEKEFLAAQKAAEALTKAESELTKAQTALGESMVSRAFKEQESAITQLAQFHLLTEHQKREQLLAIYAQEEADALSILQDQLAKQKAAMDAAQQKVTAAEGNPIFTDAQVSDLKKNLALAQIEYTKSQTEITKTEEKFDKERLAQQKDSIAQAIAALNAYQSVELRANEAKLQAIDLEIRLAQARGQDTSALISQRTTLLQSIAAQQQQETAQKQQLILDLQLHQARLAAIQDEIAVAKAEGLDTSALKAEENEIQRQIQILNRQVQALTHVKTTQDLVSAAFKQTGPVLSAFQKEMEQTGSVAMSVASAMGEAIAATTMAYANSAQSITQSLAKIAQAEIQGIASIADKKGTEQLAEAAGSWPDFAAMAEHFASATLWFSLGGALAAASGALSGVGSSKSTSTSSGTSSTGTTSTSAATTAQPQPVQSVNVQSFAAGGMFTKPTLALIGDSEQGGDAQEAAIPLDDRRALDTIAGAIAPALLRAFSQQQRYQPGATSALLPQSTLAAAGAAAASVPFSIQRSEEYAPSAAQKERDAQQIAQALAKALDGKTPLSGKIQIELKTDVHQTIKSINHEVNSGRARLLASNSIRVTKRS